MRFSRVNAVLEKFKGSERLLRAMQPYKISLYFILTPLHKERFPVAFFFFGVCHVQSPLADNFQLNLFFRMKGNKIRWN